MAVITTLRKNGWRLAAFLLGAILLLVSPINLIGRVAGVVQAAPGASVGTASGGGYCTPANVGTWNTRIHVKCVETFDDGSGGSTIQFFAVPASSVAFAARAESLMSAAIVSGHKLYVFYDPSDLSGGSIGCNTSDCRLLTGIVLVP